MDDGSRSLQSRNTKNLSLAIDAHGDEESVSSRTESNNNSDNETGSSDSLLLGNFNIRPALGRNDTGSSTTSNNIYKKTFSSGVGDIGKKRSVGGNSIYTLTTRLDKVKSSSPVYASSMNVDGKKKLNRVHSLSLSVRTKNLNNTNTVAAGAPMTSTVEMVSNHSRNRSLTLSGMETSTPISSHNSDTLINRNSGISKLVSSKGGDEDDDSYRKAGDNFNMDTLYSEIYRNTTYTNGPLLVVSPSIYLYSEPQLSTILDFQVVINVAKEIENLSPQIPSDKDIAYYHIPWTHSSHISKDLLYLTDIMHEAEQRGKKVLVHCQCGVSRSASLIVAYMMRYEKLTLNDAYNKLKKTAKDISPNMGLIFQLMEFNDMLSNIENSPSDTKVLEVPTELKSKDNKMQNLNTPQLMRDIIEDGHISNTYNSTTISESTSANSSVSTNSLTLHNEPIMLLNNKEATLVNLPHNNILNSNYKNPATEIADTAHHMM